MKPLMRSSVVLTVILVATGVASASALAAPQYVINKVVFSGEETVEMKPKTGTNIDLATVLTGGGTIIILCTGVSLNAGKLRNNFKAGAKAINFEGCQVDTPSSCAVGSKLTTTEVTAEAVDTGTTGVSLKFRPETTSTFLTINIVGESCPLEGMYALKGSVECEELSPSIEEVSKGCNFTKTSGSALTLAGNAADFLAESEFALTGANKGKLWFVRH